MHGWTYNRKIYLSKFKYIANPNPHVDSFTFYYLFIFTIYFSFYTITKKTDLSVLMLHHLCNMLLENYEAKRPFKLTTL